MKKILFLILLSFLIHTKTQAQIEDVGISKYAVLEVLKDNTPLREKQTKMSNRIGHLFKDAVLFADKQTKDYYRVELSENNYAWIDKKFVEVQAIIPEKRFDNIEKITFKNNKKDYKIKIETPSQSAFLIKENKNNLDFTLFDNRYDPTQAEILNQNNNFSIPKRISNEFNIKYDANKPFFGYGVEKYEKGYIYTIKKPPKISKEKPLKNMTVVVDPGHGGIEKGIVAFGIEEKKINLDISKKLRRELKKRGAKVYLTRKKDITVPLYDRPAFAKEKNADILLSIHQNSLEDHSQIINKYGVGTYYYHPQSKNLAQKIQERLLLATNFKDDNVNHRSFALTRPTDQISVLIECGYLIRKEEADKLIQKKFQKNIAKAITKGCEDYLRFNFAK